MNLQAILHTPLSKDAYMTGEKSVVIRLRAAKGDLKSVTLFFGDRVCVKEPITVEAVPMKCVESDMLFDHFECSVTSDFTRICYYFKLTDESGTTVYYSEHGFDEKMECHRTQYFQFPYLRREDQITMPEVAISIR